MAKSTTKEKEETVAETVEQPVAETIEAPPADAQPLGQPEEGLNIQDLQTAAQIISICSARGAFKAEEMEQVGGLYNKLSKFLQQAADAQAAQQQNQG